MPAWLKLELTGGGLLLGGAGLFISYMRGWFRQEWSSTADDHDLLGMLGIILAIIGVVLMVWSIP